MNVGHVQLVTTVLWSLAVLTIFAQVVIVTLLASFLFPKQLTSVALFFGKHAFVLAFNVALVATSGSLFMSDVAHFAPCILCWFQRIFMYPQVVLLGVALWKKDTHIADYGIALSIIGGLIAIYHYLMQIGIIASGPCSAVGYSVSCTTNFFLYFGYISIPLMSLTAFLLMLFLLLAGKEFAKKSLKQ